MFPVKLVNISSCNISLQSVFCSVENHDVSVNYKFNMSVEDMSGHQVFQNLKNTIVSMFFALSVSLSLKQAPTFYQEDNWLRNSAFIKPYCSFCVSVFTSSSQRIQSVYVYLFSLLCTINLNIIFLQALFFYKDTGKNPSTVESFSVNPHPRAPGLYASHTAV